MKPNSKRDSVIAALLQLTEEERYKMGSRLPSERELARSLGIGRNALREAMISLEAMGVIEKKERQGIFVRSSTTEAEEVVHNLQHMQIPPIEFMPMQMEVRMMICVPAVELAAIRRTGENLEKLWNCYGEFANCPFSTPEEEMANAKWEALLHHLETEASHNLLLSRISESIASLVDRNNAFVHHHVIIRNAEWFEHIKDQHRQIIEAIEKRDSLAAGNKLKEHFIESYEAIRKYYPQYLVGSSRMYWEVVNLLPDSHQ